MFPRLLVKNFPGPAFHQSVLVCFLAPDPKLTTAFNRILPQISIAQTPEQEPEPEPEEEVM